MRFKRLFSYLLIAGGAGLVFLGAREYLDSRMGQAEAANEFTKAAPPVAHSPAATRRGEPLAQLLFPRLDKKLVVIEGAGKAELRRGPGHLAGSAMPGGAGNCVIAGHRDTHFRLLKDLRPGDDIILATRGDRFRYRVKSTRVVSPKNTLALQPTATPELNLITCYPFYYVGSAPKRFVVRAQLVGGDS